MAFPVAFARDQVGGTRNRHCRSLRGRHIAAVHMAVTAVMQSGCGDGPAADEWHGTVRDSAGIVIVESTTPAWTEASAWRLSDRPTIEIGAGIGGDAATQFANIVGVHRLTHGMIAVVDAWAPAVTFFDSTGVMLGRIGRFGSGPGEFPPRSVGRSFTCGSDTVFVVLGQRIAAYVSPGEYVRTLTLERPATVRTCGGDGFIANASFGARRSSPGVYTDSTLVLAFGTEGSLRAVVDTLPRQISDWMAGPEGGLGYLPMPFSPTLSVAAGDSMMATGYGATFEIQLRTASGAVARILRLLGPERMVGSDDVAKFRDYVLNPWRGNEDERRRLEQRLSAAPGQTLPGFAELRFDRDGNVWARAYDHLDAVAFYDYSGVARGFARPTITAARRWAVFNSDGHYLGTLDIPPNFTVHEIGRDAVLGIWTDELDIQYVRQYPLIKPEG